MVTVRHIGTRWVLAGLAMTGLAGGVLAATDQPGDAGSAASDTAQSSDSGPAADRGEPQAHRGGWDGPGGPQARPMGPPRWHRPAMPGGRHFGEPMLDRPLLLAFRRLDLTDQQWQRVQAILEVQHLRSGAGTTAEQRQAQMAALFDPASAQHTQAVQAIKDRAVARIDQAAHTQQALYQVLTPAQKTHLQQLIARRRARMQERLQQRAGEAGQGAAEAAPSVNGGP
jgi:Spy/CpxP family protein refolding chaperone